MDKISLWAFFLLSVIGLALVNSNDFGVATIASPLLAGISTGLSAILIFGFILFHKANSFPISTSFLCFNALGVYFIVQGYLLGTSSFSPLIWLLYILFFNTVFYVYNTIQDKSHRLRLQALAGKGLLITSLLEVFIILFQLLNLIPSRNTLFIVTGSWSNPNVTAIFLSASLYLILQTGGGFHSRKKLIFWSVLLIVLSICLLQCRTAILITALVIIHKYQTQILSFIKIAQIKSIHWAMIWGIALLSVVGLVMLKVDSTRGRLLVIKNSLSLFAEQPVWGVGAGQFAREYNLYIGANAMPSNGFVNMPYNDFIELAVEGGAVGLLLWMIFLFSVYIENKRKGYSQLPLILLLILQLTNFGIQSIPVFLLILLCLNIPTPLLTNDSSRAKDILWKGRKSRIPALLMVFAATFLFVRMVSISSSLKDLKRLTLSRSLNDPEIERLNENLDILPYFHEVAGDAYMSRKDLIKARGQYSIALTQTSYPGILVKKGYTFLQENKYDSSLFYYNLAKRIEPYKFATRFLVLQLYEQKKDTLNIISSAKDILDLPVKVESEKVEVIRNYAKNAILKFN